MQNIDFSQPSSQCYQSVSTCKMLSRHSEFKIRDDGRVGCIQTKSNTLNKDWSVISCVFSLNGGGAIGPNVHICGDDDEPCVQLNLMLRVEAYCTSACSLFIVQNTRAFGLHVMRTAIYFIQLKLQMNSQ